MDKLVVLNYKGQSLIETFLFDALCRHVIEIQELMFYFQWLIQSYEISYMFDPLHTLNCLLISLYNKKQ